MTSTPINLASLHTTFDDEFNSFTASPYGSIGWSTTYPWGGGYETSRTLAQSTGEEEYYSDSSVGVNPFSLVNGVLDITAAPAAAGSNPYNLPYTSGVITTGHSFAQTYGFFEMRAELPAGQGLWPAFWLMPVNGTSPVELDVMEMLGNHPNYIYSTTHDLVNGAQTGISTWVPTVNTSVGFHTFGVDWEPNTITFYVDGQITAVVPTPVDMHVPMYMIANLAVGGPGSWPGAANASTPMPATMQIDYIRAYATAATIDVAGNSAITTGGVAGQVQAGGVAQPGVTVTLLNSNGTVATTTTTDSNGNFSLYGYQQGNYTLEYTQGGQIMVAAASISAGLSTSLAATAFQAGATVTGTVTYVGASEAGAPVALVNSAGVTVATTTTSATGGYSFAGVVAGSYQVEYTAPNGTVLQPGSQATVGTGLTAAFSLASGQSLALPTENLVQASSISGTVQLNGTTAVAGDSVSLLNAGTVVASTTTSATGAYSFANLEAGSYQLQFTAPTGDVLQLGSQANPTGGLTSALTLATGQSLTVGAENLLSNPGIIQGTVHHYGAASDPSWGSAQAGVTVGLVNAAGTVIGTAVTNSAGWFEFTDVTAGSYRLQYTPAAGTALQPGGTANLATGLTAAFSITTGQNYWAPLTGVVAGGAVTGQVLLAGAAEAGVAVELLNNAGTVVGTATTSSTGSFAFNTLETGSYQVAYAAPAGQLLASGPANSATGLTGTLSVVLGQTNTLAAENVIPAGVIGGSVVYAGAGQSGVAVSLLSSSGSVLATTSSASDGSFSFTGLNAGSYAVQYAAPATESWASAGLASTVTGITAPIALAAGQTLALGAETLVPTGQVAGSVQFAGAGEAGVTVTLENAAGSTIATATTASDGSFAFTSLFAGSYAVQYALPTGQTWASTSLASTATGITAPIALAAGQQLSLAAETLLPTGQIAGSVSYLGTADAGVAVSLLNAAGSTIATATTSATGGFSFGTLYAGSYQVQYTPPATQMVASGSLAVTAPLPLAAGQSLTLGAESMVAAPATITGTVLENGAAEAGVSVSLINSAGKVAATSVSGSTGGYSFAGLAAGSYQVKFTAPSGQVFANGGLAAIATGTTQTSSVTAGQTLALGAENLLSNPAILEGSVNHLGSADPSWGTGQYGVTVSLLNTAGSVIGTTVTTGGGWYEFTNLAAVSYQLAYAPTADEAMKTAPSVTETVAAGGATWAPVADVVSISNSFAMSGANPVALRGAGNYQVTGTATNATLTLGAGNQSVALSGTGEHITVGAGTSTISAGSGSAVVHAAGGNVTITAGGANNLFDSGTGIGFLNADGSAGNTFMLDAAGQGLITIGGFNPATTDVLDLSRTLAGTGILSDLSNVGSYVTASYAAGNTTLLVDPTGGQGTPSAFAVLNGVDTSVAQLLAGHHLSLA